MAMARSNKSRCKPTTILKGPSAASGSTLAPRRQIEFLPITDLNPDPRNPRKHNRAQIRAIARSIKAFGFTSPILIDKHRQIIAGHGRLEAVKLLGCTQVPVIRFEHLTETQAMALRLADNKLSDRSTWDDNEVAIQLKELSELTLNFDIEVTGFEPPEIDLRIQSLDAADTTDDADDFNVVVGSAVSRDGDFWQLDQHRILCGSAIDPMAYESVIGAEKANAVFTDPPYNVKIDGHVCGKGAIKHREFAMASGEMNADEFTHFLTQTFELLSTYATPGALMYACMDWRHMTEILTAIHATGSDLLNLCVWIKNNGGMGSLYRSGHELVFVTRNGKEPHLNNVQLGRFGRNRNNVWHYAGANSFARNGRHGALALHPTVKPIALVSDAILDCTKRNDIVLDPYLGSGTTLLAAERTGRRCYGIEIDGRYVDTAIERWERLTGRKAQNIHGQTFAQVKLDRRAHQ
jgi:DNA modification methylase